MHVDNKKEDILFLGRDPKKELHRATLTADAKYSFDFTKKRKKICLGLH